MTGKRCAPAVAAAHYRAIYESVISDRKALRTGGRGGALSSRLREGGE